MTHDPAATATQGDLSSLEERLMVFIQKEGEETRRHFDVVAEDIRHDIAGANRDEISVLQDAKADHSSRISKIEHVVGLAV